MSIVDHKPTIATHNGELTITSTATGEHRTFRIKTQSKDANFAAGERIVSLLNGPDNETAYQSFGFVRLNGNRASVYVWNIKRGGQFERFARLLERLDEHEEAGRVIVQFATVCRVCNRKLTDPLSIELGIGPVCRGE